MIYVDLHGHRIKVVIPKGIELYFTQKDPFLCKNQFVELSFFFEELQICMNPFFQWFMVNNGGCRGNFGFLFPPYS